MTCRLVVRFAILILTAYVCLVRPSCTVLTRPSIHWIFFSSSDYHCPWYQSAFALASAFYVWEILDIFCERERRKDFVLLLIHHIATLFCLFIGYTIHAYEISMIVLWLHDLSDPFLDISRIANSLYEDRSGRLDSRLVRVADVAMPVLLVTWFCSRLYLFPLRCIWAASRSLRTCDFVYAYWVTMVLALLFLLNVAWAGMIVRALVHRLKLGLFTDETVEDPDPVDLENKRTSLAEAHEKQQ